LKPGGRILLEPHTFESLEREGGGSTSWSASTSGLFSPDPHCWLEEHFWHADTQAATTRHFILDAKTGEVTRYASTSQAYTDAGYDELLLEAGFSSIRRFDSLSGSAEDRHEALVVIVATKPES
jgi:hypothetical protein